MKTLLLLSLIILGFSANAQPIANAGPDQTIYLTQTNSVTLNGSASLGDSYQWTDVSTDYKSGAVITSPASATTTVMGLEQGVWYYELAVSSGGITKRDTVAILVDYDVPPANSYFMVGAPFDSIASTVNNHSDTLGLGLTQWHYYPGYTIFFDKGRSLDMSIDGQNKKFYSTVEDGYPWSGNSYGRAEMSYGYGSGQGAPIDSNQTYLFEWKGYFPQSDSLMTTGGSNNSVATVIFQLHSRDDNSPPFQFALEKDSITKRTGIYFIEIAPPYVGYTSNVKIADFSDFYNKTHTIRIELKEGKAGNGNYIKITLDGKQVYFRNTGDVGRTWQQDYPKFATVYDFDNRLVDNKSSDIPAIRSRGRKFSLVTESFKIYTLSKSSPSNSAPTANAGSNQSITLPVNSVNLVGSGSDVDGTIVSYLWTKISGPSTYTIVSPNSASTNITGLAQGVYQFQLTVTDNQGATGKSTVQVTVNLSNQSPKASAGPDQSITLPASNVDLNGNGSDSDGTITSYLWTKISGPSSFNIANPSSATTSVSGLVQGNYTFQLKVTDNNGAIATDTVNITVLAANIIPKANAGADQSITLPVNSVNLAGSGSDSGGTITTYLWTKISGPSAFNITSSGSATTTVSGLVQGNYSFQLKVTDNNGFTAMDTVNITVLAANNLPPTANAGSNQSITLPANSVSLTGSGTDSDGTIASYKWTKASGPSSYNIISADSSTTSITGLTQGVYKFQLTVTDNKGDIGTAAVQITVNAAANVPPTANAGSDQSITLPTNSANLTGSGSDVDGTVASYKWTKISGPSTYNIVNPSSPVTNVSGLVQGVYSFQLTVTDNKGATGSATVQVTVNAAANVPPTANAGPNRNITLPTSSVSLAGSGSDADGTIASYKWTKSSGPSTYNIVNPSSPVTDVSGLVQGVYSFQLTVTDNKGATGSATVQVTVNAAANIPPTANAGPNRNITLPTSSVSLAGSGSDADGTIASYKWTKSSGPSTYNIVNPSSPVTDVSGLVQGVYSFQLTVTDNKGATGSATVQVTVNAAGNIPPAANAGPNQSITLPTSSVNLTGSGSDVDGTIASYKWAQTSGPSSYNIVSPSSAKTNITGLVQGVYSFQLTVTDNSGATGSATVQVTVNAPANIPPKANAGSNQSITLPTNIASLSGSGSDADGKISSYKWTKVSGPSAYNIVNPSSPLTDVSGLVQGVYSFQLTVTDNSGATGTATVQVTVKAATNIPPTANAGPNRNITLPTNSVSLAGSGSDADGRIASYKWTKVSGPSTYNIVNPSSPVTDVSGLIQGVYSFQLTVTDNSGATGSATVQVTVNPDVSTAVSRPSNVAPVANAGNDTTIVYPDNSITLNGSGTDSDGHVVSYLWSQVSGPSVSTIFPNNTASTYISNLVEGSYQFELTVTDNKGAVGKDTVNVIVGAGRFAREANNNVKVYPNPVHDIANLAINTAQANTDIIIVITDLTGKLVYREEFVSSTNSITKQINMGNLIKGTYVVTLYFNGAEKQSIKVMRM